MKPPKLREGQTMGQQQAPGRPAVRWSARSAKPTDEFSPRCSRSAVASRCPRLLLLFAAQTLHDFFGNLLVHQRNLEQFFYRSFFDFLDAAERA